MTEPPEMTTRELRNIIREIYGARGQRKMAHDILRTEVTMSRWLSQTTPIGEHEALIMRILLILHRRKLNWKRWLRDYYESLAIPQSIEDLF